MEIIDVHPLNIEAVNFVDIQKYLSNKVNLNNHQIIKDIKLCAGTDVAYWKKDGIECGVCSIIVIDYITKRIVEKVSSTGEILIPYVSGLLTFRELPLILETVKKLIHVPDVFMFDGNGYLHPEHMGIATHASFFLNKPTIGIAKNYLKINGVNYNMPENEVGHFQDIIVNNVVYGRVLRTRKDVKPIFISSGNYIDLQTTTEITLNVMSDESRLPIPVRLADLETKRIKRQIMK